MKMTSFLYLDLNSKMSVTNITYETNQISLLLDSMMSGKLNVYLLFILL